MLTITDMLGWIGTIVSICFFASPGPRFYYLIKKKIRYEDINIIIIFGSYISSVVWLIYGFSIKLKQIKICYSIGALLSLIWIWIYLTYMSKRKMTKAMILLMGLSVLTFAIYIILTVVITDKKLIGNICFIVCSISYISPAQLIIKVINSKNYKLIPIYSTIIAAIGYGSWTLYGLFNFIGNIIIPNLVGLGFSLAQIILYRVYKNKTPLTEEINNISHSVIGVMKNVMDKTVEIANSITPNQLKSQNVQENVKTEQNLKVSNNTTSTNGNNNANINIDPNINANENVNVPISVNDNNEIKIN